MHCSKQQSPKCRLKMKIEYNKYNKKNISSVSNAFSTQSSFNPIMEPTFLISLLGLSLSEEQCTGLNTPVEHRQHLAAYNESWKRKT